MPIKLTGGACFAMFLMLAVPALAEPQVQLSMGRTDIPATIPHEQSIQTPRLVALDPCAEFKKSAEKLGFHVIDTQEMTNLGVQMMHLSAPPNMTTAQAVTLLSAKFPDTVFDTDGEFTQGPELDF